jgi:hypothetical protein
MVVLGVEAVVAETSVLPAAKPTSLRPLDLKPDHDRRGE